MFLSPASPKSFPRGRGDARRPMWHVRRDDGHVLRIEEAALQALPSNPAVAARIGLHHGPLSLPRAAATYQLVGIWRLARESLRGV